MVPGKCSSCLVLATCLLVAGVLAQERRSFIPSSSLRLTMKLMRSLEEKKTPLENYFVSPFSILTGIGMLYEGMEGEFRDETASTFSFPPNDKEFREQFKAAIPSNSSSTTFANLITVAESSEIRNEYGDLVRKVFRANPFRHPFDKRPKLAENLINKWVAQQSDNKIKGFLPPDTVTESTRLVLVNVVHFKSDWLEPFEKEETTAAEWFTNFFDQPRVDIVEMMQGDRTVGYEKVGQHEVIQMEFEDEDVAMTVIMPGEEADIKDALNLLAEPDSPLVNRMLVPDALPQVHAKVSMPKFKLDQRLELKSLFAEDAGIRKIFNPSIDLSRMVTKSEGLYVDEIHHKAVIEANEKGVEATGATGATITLLSAFGPEMEIRMDRPFLFFITDRPRMNILFAGKMADPKQN